MNQLSKMSHNDMITILNHLDCLVADVDNLDMQILHNKAELYKYTKNVVKGKKRHGGVIYFLMNLLIPFAIIFALVLIFGGLDLSLVIAEAVTISLIIISFCLKKRADKKLINNQFTQDIAESMISLFGEREKAQNNCNNYCYSYSIPGVLKNRDAIQYVTRLLAQYHNISLKRAVDEYCKSEQEKEARAERERQLREIESIHKDIQKLHSEVRRGNIENEIANNKRNHILSEIRYRN